jgi:hypothetical protein
MTISIEDINGRSIDYIMEVIEAEQAKHKKLVDAAVAWANAYELNPTRKEAVDLLNAIQPFLPEPKASDELDKLAEEPDKPGWMHAELHKLADKVRKLENENT